MVGICPHAFIALRKFFVISHLYAIVITWYPKPTLGSGGDCAEIQKFPWIK